MSRFSFVQAKILALGHYNNFSDNKKSEVFDTEKNNWLAVGDYPYDKE